MNGIRVNTLGTKVLPTDDVIIEGRRLQGPQTWHYYLLNKPTGVLCTAHDPQGRATVMQMLKDIPVRVYPVGRLDSDSSGLLLLTNDGELAHRLAHPSYGVEKTYRVWVESPLSPAQLTALAKGIELEDGKTAPAKVKVLFGDPSVIEISIHEGKNRQVRRMFGVIGHPVQRLQRVRYGPLVLDKSLGLGAYRRLTDTELTALAKLVGLDRVFDQGD